ncbi:MAG: peptidoglycan/LPS O-acetylase OafA/YrhL [Psychroserpens sp.]|jgi:peptidoglycan/LPS O-acetylase OafA/YrhL
MIILLEITRGLAALWVFMFHINGSFKDSIPMLYWFAKHGSLGVPMFFVISGYVITHSAESSVSNNKNPTIFLKNRFLRIYPTFWASVIIVLAIPYFIESISFLKSGAFVWPTNKLIVFDISEWFNFLLLSKVFMASAGDLQGEFTAINAVYWTLAIEFQFYLVVFLLLYTKEHFKMVVLLFSLVCGALMLTSVHINYGIFVNYWPSFSVGIGLAYLHLNNIKFSLNTLHVLCIIAFMSFGVLLSQLTTIETFNLGFAICFGCLLFCISNFEQVFNKIKNGNNKIFYFLLKPWLVLGAMSYSVYLVHGKIYQIPAMFVRQFLIPTNPFYPILIIIGTLFLCLPIFYLVEKRFLSKNYKKIHEDIMVKK